MTWNGLSSYSATPSSNTKANGINIDEGCNAANINDAIRQIMADLAAAVAAGQLASPGDIKANAGTTVPDGWLACDGSAVSRTTYAALFAVISDTYGNGDGSTTFNVPDYRGRVILGSGTGTDLTVRTVGDTGGAETHTLTEAELPAHTHTATSTSTSTVTDPGHAHSQASGTVLTNSGATNQGAGSGGWSNGGLTSSNATGVTVATATTTTVADTGSGDAHSIMPPYAVALVIIKT